MASEHVPPASRLLSWVLVLLQLSEFFRCLKQSDNFLSCPVKCEDHSVRFSKTRTSNIDFFHSTIPSWKDMSPTNLPAPTCVALIAESVEHCTGIAEVRGSNPVEAA